MPYFNRGKSQSIGFYLGHRLCWIYFFCGMLRNEDQITCNFQFRIFLINKEFTGRVEDWRANLGRSLCSLFARPFVRECHNISTISRFQPPPLRTQHADFPHYALLHISRQGLWDRSCWSCFQRRPEVLDAVLIEKSQRLIKPSSTPPLPAEASALAGSCQVPPNLHSNPVSYVLKASA